MVDLKPCPFCGGAAKTDACMDPSLVRCVSDTSPHCPASFGGVSVETWNRRSSIAAEKAEEPAPTASACPSCDDAWGLIANAHGGDWSKASDEWQAAATRWRDAWTSVRPTASAQGEPSLEDCQRAAIEATRERHPNASDLALLLSPDEAAQVAAVRALCLSRAPSIEDVIDALLRVQPFRDGHETGSTGLVRRADVEQVMRALFDRRVT